MINIFKIVFICTNCTDQKIAFKAPLMIKGQIIKRYLRKPNPNNTMPKQQSKMDDNIFGYVAQSQAMRTIHARIRAAAASRANVFLIGESGVGKEIYARAIHRLSRRAKQSYLPFNCACLSRDMAQSELFGHERGAFTGAIASHAGVIERANGGTLFLDEIGEMDVRIQPKLLRFTEDGHFYRLGGRNLHHSDVRIISASNSDPIDAMAAGRLRQDLFYRLHILVLRIPPLRERGPDIPHLATYFLARLRRQQESSFVGFTDAARHVLLRHPWPGNIRQLKNVLHAVSAMERTPNETERPMDAPVLERYLSDYTDVSDFGDRAPTHDHPRPDRPDRTAHSKGIVVPADSLEILRDKTIRRTLNDCGHNVARAALMLGIHPSTIYRRQKHWHQSKLTRPGHKTDPLASDS